MADTLCGPSNPLQTFQKATQADRSLQQDRFTSRPVPGGPQGFRSDHGAPAGLLDPEFEAFKNGAPPGLIPEQQIPHPSQHHFPRQQQTPRFGGQAEEAAWANDFQRMHVSQPAQGGSMYASPLQQQQQPSSFGGWHQEFQRQHSPAPQYSPQMSFQQRPSFASQQPMFQSQFPSYSQPAYNQPQAFDKGKSRLKEDEADAAAFEAEFEAQTRSLMQEQSEAEHVDAHGMDSTQEKLDAVNDSAARVYQNYKEMQDTHQQQESTQTADQTQDQDQGQDFNATATDADDFPMRPLYEDPDEMRQRDQARGHQTAEEDYHAQQLELERNKKATDDDLAHTASELLDRVSDNTSQKFKDSSFLALMTQLRDREVRVEGDQFVDVNPGSQPGPIMQGDDVSHSSTSSAQTQPLDYLYAEGSALESSTTDTRNNERYMAGALDPDPNTEADSTIGSTMDAQPPSQRTPPNPHIHQHRHSPRRNSMTTFLDSRRRSKGPMAHELYPRHAVDDF